MQDRRNKRQQTLEARESVKIEEIDYKNVALLQNFISGRYKIVPRRYTKLSSKAQRRMSTAIKRARQIGLLRYTERH